MKLFYYAAAAMLSCTVVSAAEVAGTPRDSNIQNTAGYDGTRVEAQLLVNVQDKTKVVHFIRDNNDPRVVTKTYLLKHRKFVVLLLTLFYERYIFIFTVATQRRGSLTDQGRK